MARVEIALDDAAAVFSCVEQQGSSVEQQGIFVENDQNL
jgi:hypothetical protein